MLALILSMALSAAPTITVVPPVVALVQTKTKLAAWATVELKARRGSQKVQAVKTIKVFACPSCPDGLAATVSDGLDRPFSALLPKAVVTP